MPSEPEYADPQRYIELVGFEGTWRDLFWNRDFLDLMGRRLDFDSVRSALDVGCGGGHWTRTVLSQLPTDARMGGPDREAAFLALARERCDASRTEFMVGTAEKLPFEDNTFDLVTCQLVLIHVQDPLVALTELKRVLRPGGLLLVAEPDNRAGNIAQLGGEPRPSDEDLLSIMSLLLCCERGKLALGEGDQSIGGRMPGLFHHAGLEQVVAYTNDRCTSIVPPYDRADMKVALQQELDWFEQGVSAICGTRADNLRFFDAGGGDPEQFDLGWAAMRRWMQLVRDGIESGAYHAGRGFVMYLVAGRKPA